ncbi:hypothetical protein ABFS82_13G154500 [Erythranthe guttata]
MGIIYSIIRFLCSKTQTEDEESGRSQFLVHQPNHFFDIVTTLDNRTQWRYYDATSRQWLPKSTTSKYMTQKAAFPFAEVESKKKIVVEKPKEKKEATINNNIVKSSSTSSTRVVVAAAVDDVRWIKHYSSRHRILVVGDGDFSFSASLAVAFRTASNMTATSLDSLEFLKSNYGYAASNIDKLKSRGCQVMHEIDATVMASKKPFKDLKYDRIVFNFPFAGFYKSYSIKYQLFRHKGLVNQFMRNAREMISEDGEIHISHKTNAFHIDWDLESIASLHRLRLIEAVKFNLGDYPGYHTKCWFGGDNYFNCNPSRTYKFGLVTTNVRSY